MSISPQSHCAGADVSSSANNYNVSLPREGCARVAVCCTVHRSRRKQLLRSCGVLDGLVDLTNNYNASLPREGYACAIAYWMIRRS